MFMPHQNPYFSELSQLSCSENLLNAASSANMMNGNTLLFPETLDRGLSIVCLLQKQTNKNIPFLCKSASFLFHTVCAVSELLLN